MILFELQAIELANNNKTRPKDRIEEEKRGGEKTTC